MSGIVHTQEVALTGNQAVDSGLSPAEARRLVQQRLEPLVVPWGLKESDPHRLARRMQARTYAPGEIIVPQGVRGDCLGLVVRGQVAVYADQRGTARLVVVLLPGSTFGEAMLLEERSSHATLRALTWCEVWFLRRTDLQALSQTRRAERRSATLWRLVGTSALLLTLMLVVILVLSLPQTRTAISLVPKGIGQLCSQQGYDTCTIQAWQVASNLEPTDPNPYLAIGALHFGRGDIAAAKQAFEAAQALDPEAPEAYNNMGLVYARQGEHEQAIAAFQQALALEPGIAATEHNLALSLQATRAYEEAVEHYQAALALGEPQTSTLINMAIAHFEAGQSAEAADTARRALAYDDSLAPAYTVLGAVSLEARQPEEALPDLEQAIALDATYGPAHFYLGLVYKSLEQPEKAIAAFEQALITAGSEDTRNKIRRHLDELYGADGQGTVP